MADDPRSLNDANMDEDVFSTSWEKSESRGSIAVTGIRARAIGCCGALKSVTLSAHTQYAADSFPEKMKIVRKS